MKSIKNNKKPDFSKIVMFTDIHYGLKNNNREHNDSCERFIKWMIDEAKKEGIKTCIFGGDYHHVRSAINISTLNYSVSGLSLLNDYFDHTFFIIGNHDLFYRDKYEIHSLPYIYQFPNIIPVDKIMEFDNVALVPWLISEEWKQIRNVKAKYMFGHFELPTFKMNAMVEMPDHGTLNNTHFINQEQVFSGHFHKRQNKGKIWYIGNAFPHNYSDAWDDERGIMILTPGQTPEFKSWDGAPKYKTLTLSQLMADPAKYIDNNTFAQITIDVDVSYEDTNFIKEMLLNEFNARDIKIGNLTAEDLDYDEDAEINFESVHTIVVSHLQSIESNTLDTNKLISIYEDL